MKINNQYQEAEAIYPVTGLYIDPDGNTMEKAEMLFIGASYGRVY